MKPAHVTEARAALGLNKVEFAKLMGVAESTVRGWETGQKNMPRPAFLLLRMLFRYERKLPWGKGWDFLEK